MTDVAVAVFGESLVDVTVIGQSARVRPGGSPLNVAVGLARLGAEVEFATSIGRDAYGELVAAHLLASGVDITPGSVGDNETSRAEATIAADGSATYEFALSWDPPVRPASPALAAHFGSISAVLEPGAERVLQWISEVRSTSLVSFDPNVRASITGAGPELRTAIDRAAALADVIKLSAEDFEILDDPLCMMRWLEGQTSVVILTDGARGARLITSSEEAQLPARATRVVDTIGAGDSFMAGLLWSLGNAGKLDRAALAESSIDELAGHTAFAAGCAAVTVSREGADPPRRDELSL